MGRIAYHPLTREGWLTLQAGAGAFEGDVLPALRQTITLHPVGNATQVLCKFERARWGRFRFDVGAAGGGVIESRAPWRLQVTLRIQ